MPKYKLCCSDEKKLKHSGKTYCNGDTIELSDELAEKLSKKPDLKLKKLSAGRPPKLKEDDLGVQNKQEPAIPKTPEFPEPKKHDE